MPIFGALIGGATSLIGGLIGKSTADKQAKQQQQANAQQQALARPYVDAGGNFLGQYMNAAGANGPAGNALAIDAFRNSPLYQMTYQPAYNEAEKAYTRYAAARGTVNSGRTLQALQDRAARIGQQTFGNYLGTLQQGAGAGQNAAFGQGANIQQGTGALNSAYGAGGDALAAGALGVGKAAIGGFDRYNYNNALAQYGPRPVTGGVYG